MTTVGSNKHPIQKKGVAIWLIENTGLTFKQIADYCNLHELEVEALANAEIHGTLSGVSPIDTKEAKIEDIKACEKDPSLSLPYIVHADYDDFVTRNTSKTKQVNNDKPNAILWLISEYPMLTNQIIAKLVKSTQNTVNSIREGTHKKQGILFPQNPIHLGLCTDDDLKEVLPKQ